MGAGHIYLVTLTMGRHNVFIRHQKEPGSENKGHGQRWDAYRRQQCVLGSLHENGIYGHSRFCNTDFDDKLACLNLSGV